MDSVNKLTLSDFGLLLSWILFTPCNMSLHAATTLHYMRMRCIGKAVLQAIFRPRYTIRHEIIRVLWLRREKRMLLTMNLILICNHIFIHFYFLNFKYNSMLASANSSEPATRKKFILFWNYNTTQCGGPC